MMIPRFKPQYNWREGIAAVTPKNGQVARFEEAFAQKFGCAEAVMFAHGRSGLYALLKLWQLSNVEVICPAYTCVVVPNAIVLSGNFPVFIDCAENSFNMDLELVRDAITSKTRVIIATHLFGYAMDVEAIDEIARDAECRFGHRVYVVQDCAHSFGAKWNERLVSSYGDAALFGLNISKIINSIFGGMVTTRNRQLATDLKQWRSSNCRDAGWGRILRRWVYFLAVNVAFKKWIYSTVNWLDRHHFLDSFTKYYDEGVIDFPDDWDQLPCDLEARVGLVQLSKYDSLIERRRENARRILKELGHENGITFPEFDPTATYSHIVAQVEDREAWIERFFRRDIQLGTVIDYSVPNMRGFSKYKSYRGERSLNYSHTLINFPVY